MATLQMEIDARGMRRGADDATRSLKDVERSAERTSREVDKLSARGGGIPRATQEFRGFGSAAAGVSGVLGAGTSFSQFGRDIGSIGTNLNSATGAAFAFSRGLLEVARVKEDFGSLSREVGRTSGFMGTLIGLLRANPLLALATGLGLATTAMSIFGRDTGSATQAIDAQADAIKRLESAQQSLADRRAIEQARQRIGIVQDPNDIITTQRDYLAQQSAQITQSGRAVPAERLAAILETTVADAVEQLRNSNQFSTLTAGGIGQLQFGQISETGGIAQGGLGQSFQLGEGRQGFSAQAAQFLLDQRARQLNTQAPIQNFEGIRPNASDTPNRDQLDAFLESLRTETELLALSSEEREKRVALLQADQIALAGGVTVAEAEKQQIREQIALQQEINQLRELGQQTGEALASSFLRAATGAQSLRAALAQVLNQLSQIAQSRIVGQFGNFLGNSFGATATQANVPGGGGGGAGATPGGG